MALDGGKSHKSLRGEGHKEDFFPGRLGLEEMKSSLRVKRLG